MRGQVTRGAEEHRVAERQQAPESEQEVERAGEHGEAKRLHHKHRVETDEWRNREQYDHRRRAEHKAVRGKTGRQRGG